MCYTGACEYETYPWGYNESCKCTRPANGACPSLFEDTHKEVEDDEKTEVE